MSMAEIGATAQGGCNRQALTDADMAGRKLLSQWAQAAGCSVRVDAVGNLFVRRKGSVDGLPVVMTAAISTPNHGWEIRRRVWGAGRTGSDRVPQRSCDEHGASIELAVWCNEEGSRFPMAMMGSAVWSGRLALDKAYGLTDRAGVSVREELQRLGIATDAPVVRQAVKGSSRCTSSKDPFSSRKPRPSAW